ncbi:Protein NRDE2-like [Trichoderma ghanense]|uniref:Protein NRDE2-like n=1 Tax=Trichoderma ghanense TaxID=65468 RepID=A0ABY2GU91_9HYPO
MASPDEQGEKLIVPKFSSFKPKNPEKENPIKANKEHEPRLKKDTRDDDKSRSRRHREDRGSRHGGHESRQHRDRDRSRDRRRHRPPSRERTRYDAEKKKPASKLEGVPGLFVIDTKGDPLIIRYGGLDRSQVPAYHRREGRKILGSEGRLVLHRDGPRDLFSIRMPGEGFPSGRDGLRSKRPKTDSRPVRRVIRRDGAGSDSEEAEGFLSLVSSRKRKRDQRDEQSSDDERPSYRSIEGKAKPRQHSDSESDEDTDMSIDAVAVDQSNPLKQKSVQLSRRVKEAPEDIDAWLELVDHQDALLKAGEDLDRTVLENEAHSFAEIKVSMLESALTNTKSVEDRRRVLVYLMREGAKVWTSKATAKKWSEVLSDDDNFVLWKAHLDFLTTNITTFQYDDIKKMLLDRLRLTLSRLTTEQPKDAIEEAIFVFLRLTRFVHDAGYKELAIAAWQGLLELNFFRPLGTDNEQSVLDNFEEFWESEVPRIGDAGAKGWRHYVESGGDVDAAEPIRAAPITPSSSRDVYKAWGYLEHSRSQAAKLPARTMDDGTDDDPFRVVIFSDIRPFLFLIPTSVLPEISGQLIDAFLLFCGFAPAFRASNWTEMAYNDQFVSSSLVRLDLQPVTHIDDDTDDWYRRQPRFDMGVNATPSLSLLFGGSEWFHYIPTKSQDPIVGSLWVYEALKQLVHGAGMESLARYYLAMAFTNEQTGIKKPAKALLKQYPTNSELYNAYAVAEYANDRGVADKVIRAAIESPSLSAKWYKFLFHATWSWMDLEAGNIGLAKARLCASVDEQLKGMGTDIPEISNTTLLKAHQAFTSGFHEYLFDGDYAGASTLAECMVLLAYLTASGNTEPTSVLQGNIAAAMNTVDVVSQEFRSQDLGGSAAHERVLQYAAHLLYLHASKGPFRRVYLREKLSGFIRQFPRNSIFLALFEWSDASLRVIDETRDLLHEQVLVKEHDCVSSRMFAIQHELTRGNANTTKNAFENALASDACRNTPGLWIYYIRFCYAQKQFRNKAKDVFYRALRHCPGSKEVMMEAFATLIRDMESEELRAVYNTMTSKGMRVHVDLEEFLEKRRAERSR